MALNTSTPPLAPHDSPYGAQEDFFRAFAALEDDLLRFATALLRGDGHAGRDAVQETCLAAWGQRTRFRDADHLRSWCFRVTRCRAVSWRRKHAWRGRAMAQLSTLPVPEALQPWRTGAGESAPDAVRERSASHQLLREAVQALPRGYGAAVELHYLQGYDLERTAELLGTTRGSVKMRLVRAREHLRSTLAGRLGPEASAAAGAHRPRTAGARPACTAGPGRGEGLPAGASAARQETGQQAQEGPVPTRPAQPGPAHAPRAARAPRATRRTLRPCGGPGRLHVPRLAEATRAARATAPGPDPAHAP